MGRSIVQENHEYTAGLKLGMFFFAEEDQRCTPKRDNDGGVRKWLIEQESVWRGPDLFPRVKSSSQPVDECGCLYRPSPKEQ
jgi:hypothetical protein